MDYCPAALAATVCSGLCWLGVLGNVMWDCGAGGVGRAPAPPPGVVGVGVVVCLVIFAVFSRVLPDTTDSPRPACRTAVSLRSPPPHGDGVGGWGGVGEGFWFGGLVGFSFIGGLIVGWSEKNNKCVISL